MSEDCQNNTEPQPLGPLVSGFLAKLNNPSLREDLPQEAEQQCPQAQPEEFPWTPAQTMLLERMEGISRDGGITVLCGTRGTGKTAMAKEVQRRVGFGIYELAQDYFEQTALLVSGKLYRNIEDARKFRDRRANTRLLILDEILFLSLDPLGTRVLQDIVIRRHAAGKPTILITNAKKDALNLDDSIADRVKDGGAIFQPKWQSFRGKA